MRVLKSMSMLAVLLTSMVYQFSHSIENKHQDDCHTSGIHFCLPNSHHECFCSLFKTAEAPFSFKIEASGNVEYLLLAPKPAGCEVTSTLYKSIFDRGPPMPFSS